MTYAEAIHFLYDLRVFGAKFGLENTIKLAALAGNPQDRLRFIHVAGTNGKGSTCAMLESIYRAAGLRVGLFTSPHLVSFGERIQVDRQVIAADEVARAVSELQPLLETFPRDAHPTFFEVVTVMALRYFAEQKCGLVVWETGLGGRLDATNIVTPLASVITNIQFDHEEWLGGSLERIAFEKAGIIKPGVPVITAAEGPEPLDVIRRAAQERRSPLTVVSWADVNRPPLDRLELPLLGRHQRLNAAVALATVRARATIIPVEEAECERGLAGVRWPGRLQVFRRPDGQTFLLDGAHNPAGAEALAEALKQNFSGARPTLIVGTLRDKNWRSILLRLAPLTDKLLLAPVGSERSAVPRELASVGREANPRAAVFVCATLSEALGRAAADPFVVITGSLYLVGEALAALQISDCADTGERDLNDWTQAAAVKTAQTEALG